MGWIAWKRAEFRDRRRFFFWDSESSWCIGTGSNESISPDQLQQVFGGDQLSSLASQLGISRGGVTSMLSQLLPELVNQLTPNDRIPDNHEDLISQGLAMLKRG